MTTVQKRKKPPRLETPKKQYALTDCALSGIRGIGQLLHVLRWEGSRQELEDLPAAQGSYKVWRTDQGRAIQAVNLKEANGSKLRQIQARIAVLLRRVLPPEYRHSGVRGRSFITNAQQHLQDDPSIKLDIKSFYPSTTFQHVRRFFVEAMRCSGDVAFLLAKLCCYQQRHLPTGGVHSEVVAFYCHKRSFDQLWERVKARSGKMSVYVDDIMLTMPNASLTDLEWARRLFAKQRVKIHPGKSKVLSKRSIKVITGVEIRGGKTGAPKEQHRLIKQRFDEIRAAASADELAGAVKSLLGHLDHVAQIDPRFVNRARGTRARLKAVIDHN
ncbi:RNA-directed DNA polymerase [Rhodanobacter sp. 7MK24]|uniref:reverse transcriptase family protein n=1 Tax=Rhodanobacter sp. 7MK24 TaxID=2775922 RepID=UPI001787103D|nr:reverse transcriptase family protein [Rhodanobacter sp. 7MK24]MBD8880109.1 RNA-directed DNA polymerase [Rhodanobacter sp. 7MK24]